MRHKHSHTNRRNPVLTLPHFDFQKILLDFGDSFRILEREKIVQYYYFRELLKYSKLASASSIFDERMLTRSEYYRFPSCCRSKRVAACGCVLFGFLLKQENSTSAGSLSKISTPIAALNQLDTDWKTLAEIFKIHATLHLNFPNFNLTLCNTQEFDFTSKQKSMIENLPTL